MRKRLNISTVATWTFREWCTDLTPYPLPLTPWTLMDDYIKNTKYTSILFPSFVNFFGLLEFKFKMQDILSNSDAKNSNSSYTSILLEIYVFSFFLDLLSKIWYQFSIFDEVFQQNSENIPKFDLKIWAEKALIDRPATNSQQRLKLKLKSL